MNNFLSPLTLLITRSNFFENNDLYLTLIVIFLSCDLFWIKDFFNRIFEYIFNYLNFSKKKKVEFSCSEIKSVFSSRNVKMCGSDAFKAICYYIKIQNKDNKINGLFSLKELTSNLYDYDYDQTNNNLKEIIYIPNQIHTFTINTDEDKDIEYILQKIDLDKSNSKNIERDGVTSFCNYKLILSSSKKNTNYLQKHVDKICDIYYQALDYKILNNNYIFIFEGTDNDGQLSFSSYPFYTTCNLKNFYFKNKNKLINQIDFFLNNKNWYEERGKPYTLGICTWGLPGCGKTTFEKILTKYTDRHMIIVDISKIKNQKEADQIFFSEKINNIKIPYNKRIYVFPDVDRMTSIIHDHEKSKEKNLKKNNKKKYINNNENNNDSSSDSGNEELTNSEKKMANKISKFIKKKNDIISDDEKFITKIPFNYHNKGNSPLTMSKLLNIIDGIPERTGQIIMMSCNNPENLDKAFLRPGRIDILAEFTKMSYNDVINLVENHFNQNIDYNKLNDDLKCLDLKWTPAEVFKICSQNKNLNESINVLINNNSNEIIYPFN